MSGRLQNDFFNSFAERLRGNGFTVTPTKGKVPVFRRWQNPRPTDGKWLRRVVRSNRYSECNIGIVCGRVVAFDIDVDDPAEAERLKALAAECLGPTPFERIGRHPRTLLLYRPVDSIPSCKIGCTDVLSFGKQFVAYGVHPDTGKPYQWNDSRFNPATAKLEDVPTITAVKLRRSPKPSLSRTEALKGVSALTFETANSNSESPSTGSPRGNARQWAWMPVFDGMREDWS